MRRESIQHLASLLAAIALTIVSGACASKHAGGSWPKSILQAGRDLPQHFLVGSSDGSAPTEPTPDDVCRNPIIDPRDGTRLHLMRSKSGFGDYAVPVDRYGAAKGQLLRVECATGRGVGIVAY